jgi:hypothetical protein
MNNKRKMKKKTVTLNKRLFFLASQFQRLEEVISSIALAPCDSGRLTHPHIRSRDTLKQEPLSSIPITTSHKNINKEKGRGGKTHL